MASLPRTSTVSQTSSTLNSHREPEAPESTEKEALTPDEIQTPLGLKETDEDPHAHPFTGPNGHNIRKPLSPSDATSEPIASIVWGFVAGVALAISHHMFLAFLHGRNINEYPQYWVKNANNAFSALFSICIAFVATCVLIQIKWRVARSKPLSIRSIDNLFALPSPLALLTTVTSTRMRSLRIFLLPILTAAFIQSLALVSVFAPNALTVARGAEVWRDILVPTLNLSTGPITSIPDRTQYTTASQSWKTVLTSIMLQSPILNWKIPPGCGAACKFDLVYEGPGIECTPLEPPPYTGKVEYYPLVYNATSTLYPPPQPDPLSYWKIDAHYELQIGYIATNSSGQTTGRDGGSVQCMFRNTTYKASFQVENNTMKVDHGVQSYGRILGVDRFSFECPLDFDAPCFVDGVNTRAMCEVFASVFTGRIQFDRVNLTDTTGGINEAVIDLFFSHPFYSLNQGFHLEVSNLSESLASLFSNLTLGYIPLRSDTTTVWAEIWDGSYAWSYTVWILWVVYLPILLLASLLIHNTWLSIRSNKQGMDDKFSSLLLATRNTELDVVCIKAADFEEFQQLRLLYLREKGTFSVVSIPSEGVVEKM